MMVITDPSPSHLTLAAGSVLIVAVLSELEVLSLQLGIMMLAYRPCSAFSRCLLRGSMTAVVDYCLGLRP